MAHPVATHRGSGILGGVAAVAVSVAFIGAVALIAATQPPLADSPSGLGRGGPGANADANPEAAEQAEIAAERGEAYEQAKEQGKVGQVRPAAGSATAAAAAGWAGELPVDSISDDWEPAIAA